MKKASDNVSTEVIKGIQERKDIYDERDKVMHDLRRYRLMRHKVDLPRNWAKRLGKAGPPKVPIMLRTLQTAVTAVAKDFPRVEEEAFNIRDKPRAESSSKAWNYFLQMLDRQQRLQLITKFLFREFGDGLGVFKTTEGRWAGYPVPEEDESDSAYNDRVDEFLAQCPLPVSVTLPDPLTCYPPLDEYGEGPFVEIGWRSAKDTWNRIQRLQAGVDEEMRALPDGPAYPQREFPASSPPLFEVAEVWYDEVCFIYGKGLEGVYEIENPMGKRPYSWAFADPTGVDDPANIGMSILYPLYYIAPHIDSSVGLMQAWMQFMAPTMFTSQQASPYVRPTQETTIQTFEPGMIHHLGTGRTMGTVSPPDMGQPAIQNLNFMLGLSERAGLPDVVSGGISGTRLPALTLAKAYEDAVARLVPATRSAEFCFADMLMKCRRIVGDYGEDIPVNGWDYPEEGMKTQGWAKIEAKECLKNRPMSVELHTDTTQDEIAKGTHAQFMKQSRLWSNRRSMKYAGVRDPDDEMDEIGADIAWEMGLPLLAQKTISEDEELGPFLQAQMAAEAATTPGGGSNGTGRNREGVPAGAGGGRRGGNPTQRARGNRSQTPQSAAYQRT